MSLDTDTKLFEWIRSNNGGFLTQEQVDATNKVLSKSNIEDVSIMLSEINKWIIPVDISGDTYDLDYESMKKVYPKINKDALPIIAKYAKNYGITTKKRMAAFLATCIVESNGFNAKRESFAYSAQRLYEVFPRFRIPSLNFAKNLVAKGQVEIANHLYNGRMGNRLGTNDGWDYRGNSWIQLTGRDNHYVAQKNTGIPVGDNPKLLEDLDNACIVTMDWWQRNGLNQKADKINTYSDGYTLNTLDGSGRETKNYRYNTGAVAVRTAVNGGLNSFTEFCEYLEKCLEQL